MTARPQRRLLSGSWWGFRYPVIVSAWNKKPNDSKASAQAPGRLLSGSSPPAPVRLQGSTPGSLPRLVGVLVVGVVDGVAAALLLAGGRQTAGRQVAGR